MIYMEMLSALAGDAMRTYRKELGGQVVDHCSGVLLKSRCTGIYEKVVNYTDEEDKDCTIEAESVILAVGMQSMYVESGAFLECAEDFRKIGDCVREGNVKHVMRGVFDAAMMI